MDGLALRPVPRTFAHFKLLLLDVQFRYVALGAARAFSLVLTCCERAELVPRAPLVGYKALIVACKSYRSEHLLSAEILRIEAVQPGAFTRQ